jgi:micrococcal nuclease
MRLRFAAIPLALVGALAGAFSVSLFGPLATSISEPSQQCRHDKTTFRCVRYVRNYDADTITFNIKDVHPLIGENISVRVAGIDTPEVKTKNDCEKETARIAKKLIESILKQAQRIDLENVQRDKYFRILADVIADGRSLKDILLKNQLAYEYDGGTKQVVNWCKFRERTPAGM